MSSVFSNQWKAQKKRALVIGGAGFVGYSVAMSLLQNNWNVRILDLKRTELFEKKNIEFIVGDSSSEEIVRNAMAGIDTVFYFASHSIPSMKHKFMDYELATSLKCLDLVLKIMVEMEIKNIVFPSSGGTIYGNVKQERANEEYHLEPMCTYGEGKLLGEEIIRFYNRVYQINYLILRIGNIYGCSFYRKVQQGVVDIFIQNILQDIPITIWGKANLSVRDYIFIDDVCSAILAFLDKGFETSRIYNVGTGIGYSLIEIITYIEESIGKKAIIINEESEDSGITRNVLDIQNIIKELNWRPSYMLKDGINETIKRKQGRAGR